MDEDHVDENRKSGIEKPVHLADYVRTHLKDKNVSSPGIYIIVIFQLMISEFSLLFIATEFALCNHFGL